LGDDSRTAEQAREAQAERDRDAR
ncbi:twin-arginine translocase subunit TatA, partial [Xanthomonas oryzae pv. oryzae]